MKQVKKEAVEFLLQAAQESIVQAMQINGGKQIAAKDVAELIDAWGQINAVVIANKAFHTSQRAMLDALMEAA